MKIGGRDSSVEVNVKINKHECSIILFYLISSIQGRWKKVSLFNMIYFFKKEKKIRIQVTFFFPFFSSFN